MYQHIWANVTYNIYNTKPLNLQFLALRNACYCHFSKQVAAFSGMWCILVGCSYDSCKQEGSYKNHYF